MLFEAFRHEPIARYELKPNSDADSFVHTLGGLPANHGYSFPDLPCPLHLFARLDSSDERLGLASYPARWIPLFFGMHLASHCSDFVYQISESGAVTLVDRPLLGQLIHDPIFPGDDHPESYPEIQLTCSSTDFDPRRPKDAVEYQGVFNLKELPQESFGDAVKYGLYDPGTVSWSRDDVYPDWDDEAILRCLGTGPFFQRSPSRWCDNHKCAGWAPDYAGKKSVDVIAVLHSDPNDGFWNNAVIQFVWALCRICHSIHADYQCT